ncbi:hypothetical protein [Robertkochia sediminum]|uniref:hypothetical protein n=1 Tax=Robertkochia sediminum TaxID=2785326 RepID=UPI0019349CFC|nr:hypothetical protein [Robertkochia sediminum]MBL7472910.1 hypothetical protein [Robertkochia sediminum]
MTYYRLEHSLDLNIIGDYPQVQSSIYPSDLNDIINHSEIQRIENLSPIGVLSKKAKLTDLVSAVGKGYSLKLLVSNNLKIILEKYAIKSEFISTMLTQGKKNFNDYFIIDCNNDRTKNIDFSKSKFSVNTRRIRIGNSTQEISIGSYHELEQAIEEAKKHRNRITIDVLAFPDNFEDHFFIIRKVKGGIGYYVSEELKSAIETSRCTGIKFTEV